MRQTSLPFCTDALSHPNAPQVDPVRDLVYVVGQVPGHKGNFVLVSDSIKKAFEEQPERPVAPVPSSQVAVLKEVGRNPYEFRE